MVQHQPLIRWIILLDPNILLLRKNLERGGGIPAMVEVTLMQGYLMERYVSVYTFASEMDLLLGSTG